MARYYDVKLFKPGTRTLVREYTSYPMVGGKRQDDPGALNLLIDSYVYSADHASQQTALKIWGVPIEDIMQANNLNRLDVEIYAGFTKGLPLNNPAQSGLLLRGTVWQAFANWQGVEMTLDFVITIGGALQEQRSNLSLSWLKGTPLSQALATTLTNAFPGVKQTINIDPRLVSNHDIQGTYTSLVQLNQALQPATRELLGGSYPGVRIIQTAAGIDVQDGGVEPAARSSTTPVTPAAPATTTAGSRVISPTEGDFSITLLPTPKPPATQVSKATQPAPVQLAFQDLIGQPTWLSFGSIQFVCPMRVDLSVADVVAMPKGILGNPANPAGAPGAVTTTSASQPQIRQKSIFTGNFFITSVHHLGEFRNPASQAWVTVFEATTIGTTTS